MEFFTERRGYLLSLDRDLLGNYVLYRRWYGIRNWRWGAKRQVFLSLEEATKEFARIEKLRARRGYKAMRSESPEHR